jgi:hypothetical protein
LAELLQEISPPPEILQNDTWTAFARDRLEPRVQLRRKREEEHGESSDEGSDGQPEPIIVEGNGFFSNSSSESSSDEGDEDGDEDGGGFASTPAKFDDDDEDDDLPEIFRSGLSPDDDIGFGTGPGEKPSDDFFDSPHRKLAIGGKERLRRKIGSDSDEDEVPPDDGPPIPSLDLGEDDPPADPIPETVAEAVTPAEEPVIPVIEEPPIPVVEEQAILVIGEAVVQVVVEEPVVPVVENVVQAEEPVGQVAVADPS